MKQIDEAIIRMAREAELYEDGQFFVCKHDEIERFFQAAYAKGQADEREACAKLVESRKTGTNELVDLVRDMEARAIRARG